MVASFLVQNVNSQSKKKGKQTNLAYLRIWADHNDVNNKSIGY